MNSEKLENKNRFLKTWIMPILVGISIFLSGFVLFRTIRKERTFKEISAIQLIDEASDLLGYNFGQYYQFGTVSTKTLELVYRKLEEVSKIDPKNNELPILISLYSIETNYFDYAGEILLKEQKKNPMDAELYYLYSISLYYQEKFKIAIEQLQKTIEIDPNYIDAYIALGDCFYKLNLIKEAINSYQKVTELNPDEPIGHYYLGYFYYYQGKLEKARQSLCRVLELDLNFKNTQELLSLIIYYQGKITNLNEYDRSNACRIPPAAPRITTPGIFSTKKNPSTGEMEVIKMWENQSTGELKPIGEWWE